MQVNYFHVQVCPEWWPWQTGKYCTILLLLLLLLSCIKHNGDAWGIPSAQVDSFLGYIVVVFF